MVDHLLFYPPVDGHELRPIPKTYSWQSLQGYMRERDQKHWGDPRRHFLTKVFIPHIEEKRWQLEWWRKEDLLALDREAEEKASRSSIPTSRQATPREPAAKRNRKSPFFKNTAGKVTGLRWVPKMAIQCTQGTSVREAKEVDAELDFKFGHRDAIRPKDCDGLNEKTSQLVGVSSGSRPTEATDPFFRVQ